ncbi:tRNA uridine-5-carboxymethylaminomethyl(34) synthesis GTPase MnmE [Microbacter margulisiae]|uniref:tRNA modification GTPase MnmE n=1 Tax=Microbacter margulisiae TaxID=1350067 RepID=A0A7W5DRJ2_9PORP|nr:tRNA uridine-5-carboxymethylaminomethyl(34) synthesis GTPase MnmE [Microbacter margulisiae]MBB3186913.1 tRNA modification GTPase [Microbacter margulisiae]
MNNDTICALSTAPGQGAIAIVRLSGIDAISVAGKIFVPHRKSHPLSEQASHTVQFGDIRDPENGALIDEVLVTLFRTPHSYTGEDLVEISCHGSSYIEQQILRLLLRYGCRMAQPGEFTQRAFLDGKMDLSQAEAVADIIASESAAAHRLAVQQLKGGFSKALNDLREQLLNFTALIELELDFSEEEVEFADRSQLSELIHHIDSVISRLIDSFNVGNAIKNGIPVAIVGETNVGKSTLLNKLLHEERALVSDIHGTTRDTIEEVLVLDGIQFRFIDTAGIRDTRDHIESMGIERTFNKIEQASLLLVVLDATRDNESLATFISQITKKTAGKKRIFILNKADKITAGERKQRIDLPFPDSDPYVFLSAKKGEGIDLLEQKIVEAAQIPHIGNNDVIVTNMRHQEALSMARTAIRRVIDGMERNLSGEFLSQDIREAIFYLGTITGGAITPDEVLGSIFSRFCIGK